MRARTFDDVTQIIKPDRDSQYTLLTCECGSEDVVYAQYIDAAGAPMWRVVCTNCGATVDIHTDVKHDVQVEWNSRRKNHGKIDS